MIHINKTSEKLRYIRYMKLLEEELIVSDLLKEEDMKASEQQVGGDHYKQYKIQPYEFFIKNQIPHHKSAIIRRILRYDHPTGGGIKDLRKIKHEIDLIIEFEEWDAPPNGMRHIR